jgi:hypothetical protein
MTQESDPSSLVGPSKRPITVLQEEDRPVAQSPRKDEGGSFDNDSARINRRTTSNGNETEDEQAEVAENICTFRDAFLSKGAKWLMRFFLMLLFSIISLRSLLLQLSLATNVYRFIFYS